MCLKHCTFLSSRNNNQKSGCYSWVFIQHTQASHGITTRDNATTIDINNVNDIVDVSNDKKENYFKVDYSIRGTAKCKECKKIICKDHLRIGKSVFFRGISFLQYFHLKCAFIKFQRARK